jgi:MerR family transcriptional regulator/heat shock protein HspR
MDDHLPVYIISSAADLLNLHPRTLHLYEEKGLLVPVRKGNRRFYSASDLHWIHSIRYMVHERGLNLEGLRRLLALRAAMEYKKAQPDLKERCSEYAGPVDPCWQENPNPAECYACPVYVEARDGLCQDEEIPELVI